MKANKETIIAALYKWTAQRPGLEFVNYGDVSAYRAEMRRITRQRRDAEALIRYCEIRDSITADDLRGALSSGRLTWAEDGKGGGSLDYCTGQYWPTEYRAAVSRALSGLLWARFRDDASEGWTVEYSGSGSIGGTVRRTFATEERARQWAEQVGHGARHSAPAAIARAAATGDAIRTAARRELGASIARRWFA